jgi:hypothetical protein
MKQSIRARLLTITAVAGATLSSFGCSAAPDAAPGVDTEALTATPRAPSAPPSGDMPTGLECAIWKTTPFFWQGVAAGLYLKSGGQIYSQSQCVDEVDRATGLVSEFVELGLTKDAAECVCGYLFDGAPPHLDALNVSSDHIGAKFSHVSEHGHFNVVVGVAGDWTWPQFTNDSGGIDLPSNGLPAPTVGTTFSLKVQDCNSLWPLPDTCSQWSATVTDYVPAPGTRWIASTASPEKLAAAWPAGYALSGNPFDPRVHVTRRTLPVCTATYKGAQHVGKFDWGQCFIPWGGGEISVPNSLVLAEVPASAHWVVASSGYVPPGAVAAGRENGKPQWICLADDNEADFGRLPGKTVGDGCNVSYGGSELHVTSNYWVLATQ